MPEGEPDPQPDPMPEGEPDPQPDPAPEGEPEPQPEPEPEPGCPLGAPCNPIPIEAFPFQDARDTRQAPRSDWDGYSCAPDTSEAGGEFVYVVDIDEPGTLTVSHDEQDGDGVDIDVHLLDDLRPDACLARDHIQFSQRVEPGRYYIVADTWTNAGGMQQAGPYTLDVNFRPRGEVNACTMAARNVRMAWRSCAASMGECCAVIDGRPHAVLPCAAPVVKEAHLVTVADGFGEAWPNGRRDQLERHYQISQMATGYVMDRHEDWAPEGEGGSEWGQAAFFRKLPLIEESWYVNMFWSPRVDPGTRIIVRNPMNGRAVVGAGGYETGPGSNEMLGGVTEEIHHYLGTNHRSVLEFGFAEDQTLPYGPIECE
jgi:hypothetical protein